MTQQVRGGRGRGGLERRGEVVTFSQFGLVDHDGSWVVGQRVGWGAEGGEGWVGTE